MSPTILKRGAKGDDVKALQEMLSAAGFEVPATGTYGAWTERAVKAYQKRNGLGVDGIVGAKTMAALQPPTPRDNPRRLAEADIPAAAPTTPVRREPITPAMADASGFLEPGNIDLANRPVVRNPDGSISTLSSMSFGEDGREVLVPTIAPSGTRLSPEGAMAMYRATGKNLGKFSDPASADRYAEQLHEQQAAEYGPSSLAQMFAPPGGIGSDPDRNVVDPGDPNYRPMLQARILAGKSNADRNAMRSGAQPIFGTGAQLPPGPPLDGSSVETGNSPFGGEQPAVSPLANALMAFLRR